MVVNFTAVQLFIAVVHNRYIWIQQKIENTLIERMPKTIFKAFLGFEKPAKACFDAPKTITKV